LFVEKYEPPKTPLLERFQREGWASWTFEGGLQTFAETIADKLKENPKVSLHLNAPCDHLTFTQDRKAQASLLNDCERHGFNVYFDCRI
jgi:hypothetical protein